MNLLLLLSALLTACTGAFAEGRGAVSPPGVAWHAAKANTTDIAIPGKARRPVAGLARLVSLARGTVAVTTVIVDAEPLYAARRRE